MFMYYNFLIFCIFTFCSNTSLNPVWHGIGQFSEVIQRHFIAPYPVNCGLQGLDTGVLTLSHDTVFKYFPDRFDWIEVWRVARPRDDLDLISFKSIYNEVGSLAWGIVLLEVSRPMSLHWKGEIII